MSSVVSSADAGTHDSAQTIEAKAVVSPIPESLEWSNRRRRTALNVSADSTTKASDNGGKLFLDEHLVSGCGTAAKSNHRFV